MNGQSLLELLISMALGLFLLAIPLTILQSVNANTHTINALISIQETVRAVFHLLKQDIHQQGTQILNPSHIPITLSKRVYKVASVLLLKTGHHQIVYFLTQEGNKTLTLHRKDLSESAYNQDGIADNVADFDVQYGYVKAKQLEWLKSEDIKQWGNVKLVKIVLIVISENSIAGKPLERTMSFILGTSK